LSIFINAIHRRNREESSEPVVGGGGEKKEAGGTFLPTPRKNQCSFPQRRENGTHAFSCEAGEEKGKRRPKKSQRL